MQRGGRSWLAGNEGRYLVIGKLSGKHGIDFNPAWLVHRNHRMVGEADKGSAIRTGLISNPKPAAL